MSSFTKRKYYSKITENPSITHKRGNIASAHRNGRNGHQKGKDCQTATRDIRGNDKSNPHTIWRNENNTGGNLVKGIRICGCERHQDCNDSPKKAHTVTCDDNWKQSFDIRGTTHDMLRLWWNGANVSGIPEAANKGKRKTRWTPDNMGWHYSA